MIQFVHEDMFNALVTTALTGGYRLPASEKFCKHVKWPAQNIKEINLTVSLHLYNFITFIPERNNTGEQELVPSLIELPITI